MKLPKDMLQLAEHILDTKAGDFEPEKFEDRYENAVVEMLQCKRAGMSVPTERIARAGAECRQLDGCAETQPRDRSRECSRATQRESEEAKEARCGPARDAVADCGQGHRQRKGQGACKAGRKAAEGWIIDSVA